MLLQSFSTGFCGRNRAFGCCPWAGLLAVSRVGCDTKPLALALNTLSPTLAVSPISRTSPNLGGKRGTSRCFLSMTKRRWCWVSTSSLSGPLSWAIWVIWLHEVSTVHANHPAALVAGEELAYATRKGKYALITSCPLKDASEAVGAVKLHNASRQQNPELAKNGKVRGLANWFHEWKLCYTCPVLPWVWGALRLLQRVERSGWWRCRRPSNSEANSQSRGSKGPLKS